LFRERSRSPLSSRLADRYPAAPARRLLSGRPRRSMSPSLQGIRLLRAAPLQQSHQLRARAVDTPSSELFLNTSKPKFAPPSLATMVKCSLPPGPQAPPAWSTRCAPSTKTAKRTDLTPSPRRSYLCLYDLTLLVSLHVNSPNPLSFLPAANTRHARSLNG
jgi:hypothetical protein